MGAQFTLGWPVRLDFALPSAFESGFLAVLLGKAIRSGTCSALSSCQNRSFHFCANSVLQLQRQQQRNSSGLRLVVFVRFLTFAFFSIWAAVLVIDLGSKLWVLVLLQEGLGFAALNLLLL